MARSLNVSTALTATTADLATETALFESNTALAAFDTAAKTKINTVISVHKRRVDALKQIKASLESLQNTLDYPNEVVLTLTSAEFTALNSKVSAFSTEVTTIVDSGL